MNDCSMSSQTEQSLPQMNGSRPRSVDPGLDTKQVTSTRTSQGNGAGDMLKPAPAAKSMRLFFLDHLRAFLIILVIMGHLAITYGAIGSFYYHDTTNTLTSYVLTILVMIGQAFSMGLFFLISAYFTPVAYDHKGTGLFLRDRLLRLGLPLLIYDILIEPFVVYMAAGFPGSYWHFYSTYLLSLPGIGQGPVWFLELLLIFVVCYALWRVGAARWSHAHPQKTAPTRSTTPARSHPYPTTGEMLLFIAGLALLTFVVRIWFPQNWWFGPLNLMFAYVPQYLSLFIVGLVASRRGWITNMPDAVGKRWLWVALFDFVLLLLSFVLVVLAGLAGSMDAFLGGFHWQALYTAFWEAIMCVSLCTGLLVFFRKHVNRQGSVWNFLSANAYAAYIFHPLILVSLAYGLHFVTLYPLLKYGIAVLIAVPCCFALGALVRMIPYAKRIF
jgi:surface polysaccharide O-acyltransferase-like enzyme